MVMREGISDEAGIELSGGFSFKVTDSIGKVEGLGFPALGVVQYLHHKGPDCIYSFRAKNQ